MKTLRLCRSLKIGMAVALCAASVVLTQTAMAQAAQNKVRVDIPAQDLSAALTQFGRETGTEIVFAPDAVREKKAAAVKGELELEQALKTMLEGSGLTYRITAQGAVVIEPFQTSASEPAQQDKGRALLEEIVVTASKRESTVQSIAMSISATTGDALLKQGIQSVNDLALRTPALAIQSRGPGRTVFTIRGMTPSGGAAPTVGYYIDDTPMSPPPQTLAPGGKTIVDPNLYDLARVEVLRGPQGTLYGAGSMGGTIRLLTNQPKLDRFEASVQTTGSHTQNGGINYGESGMLNLPLGDKFALRLVETYKFDEGFIDRIVVPNFPPPSADLLTRGDVQQVAASKIYEDVNDARTRALRASLLGALTDDFSLKGSVFYQEQKQRGQNAADLPPGRFAHYQPFDLREGYDDDFTLYNLVAKYDLASFAVESSSSVTVRHTQNIGDDSENFYSLFGLGFVPGPSFVWNRSRELTEELRFTSTGDGPLQWIGGVFWNRFTGNMRYRIEAPEFLDIMGTDKVFNFREHDRITQHALFGEVSYHLTPSLNITLGLRYYDYSFDFEQNGEGIVVSPINEHVVGEASHSGFNPKLTLAYTPREDSLLYVTAAKGFRPGAPNGPVPGNIPGASCGDALAAIGLTSAPTTYAPDTVWNYELGGKASLLGRRLQINAAVYHLDWKDVQQDAALPCGFSFTANAGKVEVDGGEIELVARLGRGFTFSQNAGYADARITKRTIPVSDVDQLEGVPEWTFNSALDYEGALFGEWSLTGRINYSYTGSQYDPGALPYPLAERASFNVTNARIGVQRGRFNGALYIDNLTDRNAIVGFYPGQSATIPSTTRAILIRPRTVGIDLQWSL